MEMEKKLYEATLEGNATLFKKLIHDDPLILDRISTTFFHETPLHVAILRGHVDFVKELLSHNPRLVSRRDTLGHVPLHVAAAKGNVEIVRSLLRVGHDSVLARSKDGKVPIHLAIMKGVGVEVVEELVRMCPESTRLRVDRGDTALHLCVKFDNLDALEVIVGGNDGVDLLTARNDDGNTILHLAVLYKNFAIAKYLLSKPEIELNARNNNGLTPLDLIENSARDIKGLELLNFLLQSNAQKSTSLPPTKPQLPPNHPKKTNSNAHPRQGSKSLWKQFFTFSDNTSLEQHRGTMLIVAAIIAAASALPIIDMRANGPDLTDNYSTFALTFVPASIMIVILVTGFSLRNKLCVWIVLQLMYSSVGFLAMNFLGSMISNENRGNVDGVTIVSVLILFGLLLMVSVLNLIRLIVWVVVAYKAWAKKRKLRARNTNALSNA